MTEFYADRWLKVFGGDCRTAMQELPTGSVNTVITSPPYYGLRDYGTATWEGGDPDCDHRYGRFARGGLSNKQASNRGSNGDEASLVCRKCGANRADTQIGQEQTPEEYTAALVEVFGEIKRVLRDDGIAWLNLGDSFSSGSRTSTTLQALRGRGQVLDQKRRSKALDAETATRTTAVRPPRVEGIKPKDLFGIPWMVAFALRADGWYLRRDIVWSKPNPMPESVEDRPTSAHEYIFMLTKRPTYFYDGEAIKEPISEAMAAAIARGPRPDRQYQHDAHNRYGKRSGNRAFSDPDSLARIGASGRNRRSVWTIPTVAYPGAHYATFPPKLVEPMILASTSEKGHCTECGAPQRRKVRRQALVHHTTTADGKTMEGPYAGQSDVRNGAYVETETVGWEPTCSHDAGFEPGVVLDPFAGSGTVGMVAQSLNRRAVLIDLNPEYLEQCLSRASRQWGVGGPILRDKPTPPPPDSLWALPVENAKSSTPT